MYDGWSLRGALITHILCCCYRLSSVLLLMGWLISFLWQLLGSECHCCQLGNVYSVYKIWELWGLTSTVIKNMRFALNRNVLIYLFEVGADRWYFSTQNAKSNVDFPQIEVQNWFILMQSSQSNTCIFMLCDHTGWGAQNTFNLTVPAVKVFKL